VFNVGLTYVSFPAAGLSVSEARCHSASERTLDQRLRCKTTSSMYACETQMTTQPHTNIITEYSTQ